MLTPVLPVKIIAILSALILSGSAAFAVPVTYSFSDHLGRSGFFTFEHDAVMMGTGLHGGVAYDLEAFVLDGVSFDDGEVAIFENFRGEQYVVAAAADRNFVQLGHRGTDLFDTGAIEELFNLTFADFNLTGHNFFGMDDEPLGLIMSFEKTSGPILNNPTDPSAVPLPASLPLLIAGFGGLALLRRPARAN